MKRGHFASVVGCCLLVGLMALIVIPAMAEAKPIVLKFGTWMPERHETSKQSRWWAEQITMRTDGNLKFQFFYGGVLGKGKDQLDGLKYGIFDVGPILPAYDPAKSPLWTIPYIPWAIPDPWVRMMSVNEVSRLPEMKKELEMWDTMFLFPYALGDIYHLWTTKKPVAGINDLKGLKIRSLGEMAKSLNAIGSSPVSVPMPEVYDALSKGIFDGGCFATAPVMGYKLYEVCKFKSTIRLGMGGPIWVMKKSVFEKLPDQMKKVIQDVSLEMAKHMAEKEVEFLKKADDAFKSAHVKILNFPAEDQREYEKIAVMPVIEDWIKDKEKKGLEGRKVWETLKDAALRYEKIKN
ncbi:TRAP transporter substrate-binding protein DctP [Desulfobacula sp.]|uniref:TRAP transporter substrate-binding protein DctP n=1 Tax=Desulfobacula sp. TaxID=2593537 RepID=UPI002630D76E|nr:TRAP transporter substrate-binding protein DctP [Desulfobacula sp.]